MRIEMKTITVLAAVLIGTAAAAADRPVPAGVIPGGLAKSKCRFLPALAGTSLQKLDADRSIALMKAADVKFVGVSVFQLPLNSSGDQVSAYRKRLEDAGVRPVSYGPVEFDSEADARKAFAVAKGLGAGVLVGIPFERRADAKEGEDFRKESDAMIDVAEKLAKEFDIRFAIPNLGPDPARVYQWADHVWRKVEKRDARMGLCLDVGEEFRGGRGPSWTIHSFRTRIFCVKFRNVTEPSSNGFDVPLSSGVGDLVEVVRKLAEVGYDGPVEADCRRGIDDPACPVVEACSYIRGAADSVR